MQLYSSVRSRLWTGGEESQEVLPLWDLDFPGLDLKGTGRFFDAFLVLDAY